MSPWGGKRLQMPEINSWKKFQHAQRQTPQNTSWGQEGHESPVLRRACLKEFHNPHALGNFLHSEETGIAVFVQFLMSLALFRSYFVILVLFRLVYSYFTYVFYLFSLPIS